MGTAGLLGEPAGSPERARRIQRMRIIDATAQAVKEQSFAAVSVSSVTARAKVSRRAFYEIFDGLEDCFLAVLDEGALRVNALISRAFDREQSWLVGVRAALADLLLFFEAEPALAHVLLVEAGAAGPRARERREHHLSAVRSLIEQRWGAPRVGQAHPFVNAGVMASLLGVLHTHLVTAGEEPPIALLGPLMGLVASPYLDQSGVAREIALGDVLAGELLGRRRREQPRQSAGGVKLPDLLLDPRAHRARACVLFLAAHPGASNRQVARAVGITRDSHISTLLARLQGVGLLVKRPGPPGGATAWSPSSYGVRVANALLTQRFEGTPEQHGGVLNSCHTEEASASTLQT
jgi:AcrR family transcriptional regulator